MADVNVASRYVKSLLGLAVERNVLEQVHQDMQLFSKVVEQNFEFKNMLASPIIRHDKKRQILNAIFSGKVDKLTLAMMDILTRKNREPLLPAIAKEFHTAYNEFKGIGKAFITTTVPMDATLREQIETIAKKLSMKSKIELTEKVDKELIGGFVLNVGDQQIDASIKSKLKILSLKFSENHFVKEF
jgi:F-type H+-transporting ATPase subunit delta